MGEKTTSSGRNSSIELLRILAMCGVLLLHYNNELAGGGLLYASGLNRGILVFLESMCICAVNLYMLISGYYLSGTVKRKVVKALELLIQTALIGMAIQCVSAILSGTFRLERVLLWLIPNNYFVTLYLAVYVLSPYVNLVLGRLSRSGLNKLTGLVVLLFSIWPTAVELLEALTQTSFSGFVPISSKGSLEGYTVVNFMMMYLLGAFIRANEDRLSAVPGWKYLLGFFGSVGVLTAMASVEAVSAWEYLWCYCNPLVVLMPCCLLLVFLKWNFHSRMINHLAKSAFTCYLVHGVLITRIGVAQAVQASAPVMLVHIALSACGIYGVCHICFLIWNLVSGPVFRLIGEKTGKWNSLLTPELTGDKEVSK